MSTYEDKYLIIDYDKGFRIKNDGYELLISAKNSYRIYFLNGKRHRIGGPAVTHGSSQYWCVNDMLHRIGGPALNSVRGNAYYVNDICFTVSDSGYSGEKEYYNYIFNDAFSLAQLNKICPFCDKYFNSVNETAVHLDYELENNNHDELLKNEIINKRFILIMRKT